MPQDAWSTDYWRAASAGPYERLAGVTSVSAFVKAPKSLMRPAPATGLKPRAAESPGVNVEGEVPRLPETEGRDKLIRNLLI